MCYNFVYLILHALRILQRRCHKTCYVYQSSNEIIDDYWLVFIVSISLLGKILNACQN